MIRTRICDLLGINYPIVEGGMGEKEGVTLSVAVSNAGGLGCIRHNPFCLLGVDTRAIMRKELQEAKKQAGNPFAVNIRVGKEQIDYEDILDVVLEERGKDPELASKLRAVITSAGDGSTYVEKIKSSGALHIHKVSTVRQAKRMESAGVDALIVLGHEGGGHISFEGVGNMVLLPMVVGAVKIPVIASGGFCDAASFVAALGMGAEGIEMGTRFIATKEGGFHPRFKQAVIEASASDTVVTVGEFANVRFLKNKYIEERVLKTGGKSEDEIVDPVFKEELLKEFLTSLKERQVEAGDVENCPLPGGQVAGRINGILTVSEVIEGIMHGAEEIIQNLAARISAS